MPAPPLTSRRCSSLRCHRPPPPTTAIYSSRIAAAHCGSPPAAADAAAAAARQPGRGGAAPARHRTRTVPGADSRASLVSRPLTQRALRNVCGTPVKHKANEACVSRSTPAHLLAAPHPSPQSPRGRRAQAQSIVCCRRSQSRQGCRPVATCSAVYFCEGWPNLVSARNPTSSHASRCLLPLGLTNGRPAIALPLADAGMRARANRWDARSRPHGIYPSALVDSIYFTQPAIVSPAQPAGAHAGRTLPPSWLGFVPPVWLLSPPRPRPRRRSMRAHDGHPEPKSLSCLLPAAPSQIRSEHRAPAARARTPASRGQ